MLGKIKMLVVRGLFAVHALRLRLKGVQMGRSCYIGGRARVRKCKGSRIVLGDEVAVHSSERYNPLLRLPVSLVTLEPGACIELRSHCGVSGCKLEAASRISIGEYTIVGPGTVIYDAKEHEYSPETGWLCRSSRTGQPITIGKRCFIGMNCIILKGVTIGDDCVISAGTVINKDVPSGHIAFGNPAQYSLLPEHLRQG